jgi:hypothetical protein
MELPHMGVVAALFVAYLLLIGPVEYLLLRAANRLAWTWITYPLLVAAVSLGAWNAVSGRGPGARARQFVLRDLLPASDTFVEERHAGLFVGRPGAHTLEADASSVLAREIVSGPWQPMMYRGVPWTEAPVYEQHPAVVSGKTPKWAWLAASFAGRAPARGAGIEARLRIRPPGLGGTITSRLGHRLDDAWILALASDGHPHRFPVGALDNGEVRRLEQTAGRELHSRALRLLLQDAMGKPGRLEDLVEAVVLQTVRGLLVRGDEGGDLLTRWDPHPEHDWSRLLRAGGAVLVGRYTADGSRLRADGVETRVEGVAVLRVPLPPEVLAR